MSKPHKTLRAVFYRSEAGAEPVRDWLHGLSKDDRLKVGTDIMTVEFGWPVGMPTCRPMGHGLYEVRTNLEQKRIARTLFSIEDGNMYLLHGFIKKTKTTPKADLDLAKQRKRILEN